MEPGAAGQGHHEAGPWFRHEVGWRGGGGEVQPRAGSQQQPPARAAAGELCLGVDRPEPDGRAARDAGLRGCPGVGARGQPRFGAGPREACEVWEQPLSGDKVGDLG